MKRILLPVIFLLFYTAQAKEGNRIGFIENKGQIIDQDHKLNSSVRFLGTYNGLKIQLKDHSFSYEILTPQKFSRSQSGTLPLIANFQYQKDSVAWTSHRVDVELIGANPEPQLLAENQMQEYFNFYTPGTPAEGVTNVHQYGRVLYRNIYPNIDMEFVTTSNALHPFKYNFIVHPGGKISDIILHYNGADQVLLKNGDIEITTAGGKLVESLPESYELETQKRVKVEYQQLGLHTIGLVVEHYDHDRTVLIDPWATYFGWDVFNANGIAGINSVTTDGQLNIFTIGTTDIPTNITSSGVFQTTYGGGSYDAFIRKFTPQGFPVWCTYYGGYGADVAGGIKTDESGNIFFIISTAGGNNLATAGTFMPVLPSFFYDASVLGKLNNNGIRQWATFYLALLADMKLDHSGNIVVCGVSSDTGLATINAHQSTHAGYMDAIIVKFNGTGNRIWGTYYGGSSWEKNPSLAIDNNDNVFLGGTTQSFNNISSPGSYQSSIYNSGGLDVDAFLVKFNSSGVRQWGTYYGGADVDEQTTCLAADDSGNVYFAGPGYSSGVYATPGAFQMAPNVNDYFLAKFNGTGQRVWSTYFGGNGEEHIYGIEIDKLGNIVFAGQTGSDTGISTPGCYQPNLQGQFDCFVEKFTPAGTRIWGTYFGGAEGEDGCMQFAIDQQNNIIYGGATNSPSGIATPGAYDTSLVSLGDCFLVKFDSSGTLTTPVPELSGPASSLIKVFPNPTNDIVQVTLPSMSQGTITISDAMGKVIKSVTVKTQELTIDLKGLAAGVYLLEYKSEQVKETIKLIKE